MCKRSIRFFCRRSWKVVFHTNKKKSTYDCIFHIVFFLFIFLFSKYTLHCLYTVLYIFYKIVYNDALFYTSCYFNCSCVLFFNLFQRKSYKTTFGCWSCSKFVFYALLNMISCVFYLSWTSLFKTKEHIALMLWSLLLRLAYTTYSVRSSYCLSFSTRSIWVLKDASSSFFLFEPLCSVSVIHLQHRMILFACFLSGLFNVYHDGRLLGLKNIATRYRIWSRTKVSQPFDF